MRGKYDETVNAGDWRDRSHKQTNITPNGGIPSIEISEQRVILAESEDGTLTEQTLKELPAFSVDLTEEVLSEPFQELDQNDKPTGRTFVGIEAFLIYRSFIRHCQFKRDQRLTAAKESASNEL